MKIYFFLETLKLSQVDFFEIWNLSQMTPFHTTDDADTSNIIFIIKDTKLYVPVVTLSTKGNQKLSKILCKGFERSVYWNEYERKCESKNTKNEYRYFLKSNFFGVNRLFVLIYLNRDNDIKRLKSQRYYLPNVLSRTITSSSMEKKFYDHRIGSDIK